MCVGRGAQRVGVGQDGQARLRPAATPPGQAERVPSPQVPWAPPQRDGWRALRPRRRPRQDASLSTTHGNENTTSSPRLHPLHLDGMARHDEGTPSVIYHVVQQSAWEAAQAAGEYYPPRYDKDGFIHATHEAAPLLGRTHRPGSGRGWPPTARGAGALSGGPLGCAAESGRLGPAVQPWSRGDTHQRDALGPSRRCCSACSTSSTRRSASSTERSRCAPAPDPPERASVLLTAPRAHCRRRFSASPSTRRCSRRP